MHVMMQMTTMLRLELMKKEPFMIYCLIGQEWIDPLGKLTN